MERFNINIGFRSKEVSVEYEIDDGSFKSFFVVAYFQDGPEDITGYLSNGVIDYLQELCQRKHRDKAIDAHAISMLG